MTGDELIEEGRKLARPCIHLVEHHAQNAVPVAIWGGPGVGEIPDGAFKAWITVACESLPVGGSELSGILSIYLNQNDCRTGRVVHVQSGSFTGLKGGRPLYARMATSLPPIEGVFRLGSEHVGDWLKANGWDRSWGYNTNFRDRPVADTYERAYQSLCPLFTGGVHAVLGGWHSPWPEGDWADRLDQKLLIWTLADSEPWVEVWQRDGVFEVVQRIT